MKYPAPLRLVMSTLLVAGAALTPAMASAEGAESGQWHYTLGIYGYMPQLNTQTQFPGASQIIDSELTFHQIVENLKMGFMGAGGAHNGTWGVFTEVLYLDLGGSTSKTRNFTVDNVTVPVQADVNVDVKATIWTLAGDYRVLDNPDWTVDLLGGFRMLELKARLNYSISNPLGATGGRKDASGTDWNGIIGAHGRYHFGDHKQWFVPFYLDAGTGQSQSTWQALAGIGYKFHWGDAIASWRYLDFKGKSDKIVQDLKLNGPMIGIALHW